MLIRFTGGWGRLLRGTVPAAVLAAVVLGMAAPASAQGDICDDPNADPDQVDLECPPDENDDDDNNNNGDGERVCVHKGRELPCENEYGSFVGSPPVNYYNYFEGEIGGPVANDDGVGWGCWGRPAGESGSLPTPPDYEPGEGVWYELACIHDITDGWGLSPWPSLIWFPTAEPPPDPEDVALDLMAEIDLPRPELSLNPPATGSVLVGMPTWLHTADPAATWENPIDEDDDCVRGVCVRIWTYADRIEWDMGNGDVVTCREDQDIAWAPGMDFLNPGNACHYVYERASRSQDGGRYQVTATVYYTTEWESTNPTDGDIFENVDDYCGPDGDELCTDTVEILVEELQVLYG